VDLTFVALIGGNSGLNALGFILSNVEIPSWVGKEPASIPSRSNFAILDDDFDNGSETWRPIEENTVEDRSGGDAAPISTERKLPTASTTPAIWSLTATTLDRLLITSEPGVAAVDGGVKELESGDWDASGPVASPVELSANAAAAVIPSSPRVGRKDALSIEGISGESALTLDTMSGASKASLLLPAD
jgi:hypothetical protein